MKLLQTNLSSEQSEILLILKIIFPVTKTIDPSKVEVENLAEFNSMSVGGYEFIKDGCFPLTFSHVISYGGSYYEPPDYDVVDINERKDGQSISAFIIECLQIILKENCENQLCFEQDAAAEYPFWIQRQEDYPILF